MSPERVRELQRSYIMLEIPGKGLNKMEFLGYDAVTGRSCLKAMDGNVFQLILESFEFRVVPR